MSFRSKVWRDAMREKLARVDGSRLEPEDRAKFEELRGWLQEDLYEPPWCVYSTCVGGSVRVRVRARDAHCRDITLSAFVTVALYTTVLLARLRFLALVDFSSSDRTGLCVDRPQFLLNARAHMHASSLRRSLPHTCVLARKRWRCTRGPQDRAFVGHGVFGRRDNASLGHPRHRCQRARHILVYQPSIRPAAQQHHIVQPLGRPARPARHSQLCVRGCGHEA